MLGVIGGMGPLATADFFRKLIAATPATVDDQHIPVLIHSVPQIPSRPAAILRGGASPLPELLRARDRLLAAGATLLAMPCNTAHFWYADLTRDCAVPFVHIVDAVRVQLDPAARDIGLIATEATLAARIHEERLAAPGRVLLMPDEVEYRESVQPCIDAVKANAPAAGGRLLEAVVRSLLARGAGCVVLACTETPIALDAIDSPLRARCIDSTDALARACVTAWRSMQGANL